MIGIIYKTVAKAITFRKIAIIPNEKKLIFQVIFIFSDWILIEQIIDFQKTLPRVLSGGLGHEQKSIDSMIF